MRNFTVSKSGRVIAAIVVSAVVLGSLAYAFVLPTFRPAIRGPRYSVSIYTTTISEGFANTTEYGSCEPWVNTQNGSETVVYSTCDYIGFFTVNVTCTGCQFSGMVAGKNVSGTGNKAYDVGGFPSWPFNFAWSISKSTPTGTLEVKVGGTPGGSQFYDKSTSAPLQALSGAWGWALVFVSGNVTTLAT